MVVREMAGVEEMQSKTRQALVEAEKSREKVNGGEIYERLFEEWLDEVGVPSVEYLHNNVEEYENLRRMHYERKDIGRTGDEFMRQYVESSVNFQIGYAQWMLSMPDREIRQEAIKALIERRARETGRKNGKEGYRYLRDQVIGALGVVSVADMLMDENEDLTFRDLVMDMEADMKGSTDVVIERDNRVFQVSIKTISRQMYDELIQHNLDLVNQGRMKKEEAIAAINGMLVQRVGKDDERIVFGSGKGPKKQVDRYELKRMREYSRRQKWRGKEVVPLVVFVPTADSELIDNWTGFVNSRAKDTRAMKLFYKGRFAELGLIN